MASFRSRSTEMLHSSAFRMDTPSIRSSITRRWPSRRPSRSSISSSRARMTRSLRRTPRNLSCSRISTSTSVCLPSRRRTTRLKPSSTSSGALASPRIQRATSASLRLQQKRRSWELPKCHTVAPRSARAGAMSASDRPSHRQIAIPRTCPASRRTTRASQPPSSSTSATRRRGWRSTPSTLRAGCVAIRTRALSKSAVKRRY